ncbi:ABC transporter ATP-binding protein [Pseudovibrio exalbescens]|uniref:ABC transporter ATP-binding protein n=1 Tax=Pseudovibrio exalbescens TaxID=197461 RepID=A0A1U7JM92_9HYPH|nr:ABC transporter ATP-binding protein [Pseudovibrio exalbescens]OKL45771.1 ABC transporter ATP-binding protein [Pseudovibrio exalbescens]
MIEFQNVSKTYYLKGIEKVILDDVSFKFPKGRNVAILGHNGAGKSTMMRLLAGAELPDAGRIRRHVKVSWPLGFSGGFNGQMTGMENIRFVARMYGEDTERVIEFVQEFSELGESLTLPIQTYSSGMKARLAFGVSMAIDFRYYLIDEVTAVGDARFKRKCDEVFKQKLKRSNIVMISHSMGSIRQLCDMGCVLDKGKLYFHDDVEDAIAHHTKNQNA